jgi:hypothetical protein
MKRVLTLAHPLSESIENVRSIQNTFAKLKLLG